MFSRFTSAPQSNQTSGPREVTLTSILNTPALKLEFALLLFVCIDCMRKELVANFEIDLSIPTSSQTSSPAGSSTRPAQEDEAPPPYSPRSYNPTDAWDLMNFDEPASPEPPRDRPHPLISHESEHRTSSPSNRPLKPYEQWDREQSFVRLSQSLASPELQGFRRAALTFFDAWRISVLRRIGATLGVLGDTVRKEKLNREARGVYRFFEKGQDGSYGHYRPLHTRLQFTDSQRSVLLQSALLMLLGLENYSALSRVLLLHLAASLKLPLSTLTEHEANAATVLLTSTSSNTPQPPHPAESSNAPASSNFTWKSGLAVVGGAALIGVTGGLAAPLIAGALGVVAGPALGLLHLGGLAHLLGGLIGNSVLVGTIFGVYGGKRLSEVVEKLGGEVEGFDLIPLRPPEPISTLTGGQTTERPQSEKAAEIAQTIPPEDPPDPHLNVTIAIAGALAQPSDFSTPWLVLPNTTNLLALQYEPGLRLSLGAKITSLVRSTAFSAASALVLQNTVFATLMSGLYLPLGLLKAASILDSPFNIALSRSDKAGILLAEVLMAKAQGERPARLVGWGVGARVVWQACLELSRQNAFGLVEDVIMMGLPGPGVSGDKRETGSEIEWRRIRGVVAGRVINYYSNNDWVLRFLYRLRAGLGAVAGLEEVHARGIENFDASDLLSSGGYAACTGKLLERMGWEVDEEEVQKQEHKRREALEREQINERRRHGEVQVGLEGIGNKKGKIEMVKEETGKIVLLDLETGALDETEQDATDAAERLESLALQDRGQEERGEAARSQDAAANAEVNPGVQKPSIPPLGSTPQDTPEDNPEDEHDGSGMAYLAPEPEPEPESVSFGAPGSGINMVWEGR
ncbi:DUF726-domain-containing protein [Rhizodiscina lignyota]|uniref:DUF726-domain-containing protein n=1 Tax=Rhizodiscina lignyota TaxID=1504668 RepID=A0A9P4I4B2_9PEZI|nr:DUF726-domain-containing protein [Rhizodiscina lignyota]